MNLRTSGTRFHYDKNFAKNPVRLNRLDLIQIGELNIDPAYEVEEHDQLCNEISYIISGSGIFEHNGKSIHISPGDIIVTPDNATHRIQAANDEPLFFAYIGFKIPANAKDVPNEIIDFYNYKNQLCCKDRTGIYGHIRKCIDEYYNESDMSKLMIEAIIIQIIVSTYRLFSSGRKKNTYTHNCKDSGQLVYQILKYIDGNIYQALTVSGISDYMGYSPYYISHIFKSKMNITLQDYIGNRKIEKAQELLKLKCFTISSIAEQLNYQNTQSFSRAFHKRTGMNPSEYSKNI